MTFAGRRWRNSAILILCSSVALICYYIYGLTLHQTHFFSGWALFALMVLLALYNGRKKLSFLPLLSSAAWLQFHIYAGLLALLLLLIHVDFGLPQGILETVLMGLALLVFGSGIVGLIMSRTIPAHLNTKGEEVIFERIPIFHRKLRQDMEECIERGMAIADSPIIAQLHAGLLVDFFAGPRHVLWHLLNSQRPRHLLLSQIDENYRYLNAEEQSAMQEIKELIEIKDDLDCHYTFQSALKYWLFVHIPVTYSLFLVAIVHAFLAYAFQADIR